VRIAPFIFLICASYYRNNWLSGNHAIAKLLCQAEFQPDVSTPAKINTKPFAAPPLPLFPTALATSYKPIVLLELATTLVCDPELVDLNYGAMRVPNSADDAKAHIEEIRTDKGLNDPRGSNAAVRDLERALKT
jgi:hypothetical protein